MQKPADNGERTFIASMSDALADMGYTRDSAASEVSSGDLRCAVGRGLRALVMSGHRSFASEFLNEAGGVVVDEAMFFAMADFMIEPSNQSANSFAQTAAIRGRWYGHAWLQRALDVLPTNDEIAHERHIDQQPENRREVESHGH